MLKSILAALTVIIALQTNCFAADLSVCVLDVGSNQTDVSCNGKPDKTTSYVDFYAELSKRVKSMMELGYAVNCTSYNGGTRCICTKTN
jgi:hypothetical protein